MKVREQLVLAAVSAMMLGACGTGDSPQRPLPANDGVSIVPPDATVFPIRSNSTGIDPAGIGTVSSAVADGQHAAYNNGEGGIESLAADYPCGGCHWGPNPYLSVPSSSPYYRSVALIDNTGDPAYAQWIQLWAQQMNDVHNATRPAWPVYLYYQNVIFSGADSQPECNNGPNQYIVVCKRPTSFPPFQTPTGVAIGLGGPLNQDASHHIGIAHVDLSVAIDGDCSGKKQNLAYHELGHVMPLNHSPNQATSVMWFQIDNDCGMEGYDAADVQTMDTWYNHLVG